MIAPSPSDADDELHHQLLQLQQENDDLQLMLEVTIEHSDSLLKTLRQENRTLMSQLATGTLGRSDVDRHGQSQEHTVIDSFQGITDALSIGLIIVRTLESRILYGNIAICQFLGMSVSQLKTKKITDLCCRDTDCQRMFLAISRRQLFKGQIHWLQPDGSLSKAVVSLQPLVFQREPTILTVVHLETTLPTP
ncbi:MAG: hypothetical protein F6K31_38850 [Symploca sp. SIO2G7]|nr:hypothetical protein [Symploca sp. SIO2G7]